MIRALECSGFKLENEIWKCSLNGIRNIRCRRIKESIVDICQSKINVWSSTLTPLSKVAWKIYPLHIYHNIKTEETVNNDQSHSAVKRIVYNWITNILWKTCHSLANSRNVLKVVVVVVVVDVRKHLASQMFLPSQRITRVGSANTSGSPTLQIIE